MPGTALIRSRWPIVGIHRAHQLAGEAADHAFAEVREAIVRPRGEDALVVRDGWRAVVVPLPPADARWTESLLAGAGLADALERAGADFDFAAWLASAIRRAWLKGARAIDD